MKPFHIKMSRHIAPLLVALLAAPGDAGAQGAKLQLNLDKLAARAKATVDVTLDGAILQLATGFLSSEKSDEATVKDLIAGLKGIYVRSYTFDVEGAYSQADVESVRAQLAAPGWTRMVVARDQDSGETAEIHTRIEHNKMTALAILVAEPKEFTVVNIVGSIDLIKLSALEGQFGIPKLGLGRKGKPRDP